MRSNVFLLSESWVLPFREFLTPSEFEELVLWLLSAEEGAFASSRMGYQGETDFGIDLILQCKEGTYAVQCKRCSTLLPGQVRPALDAMVGDFRRKYLVTSAVVSARARQELRTDPICPEVLLDGVDLTRRLSHRPGIMSAFFPEFYVNQYCHLTTETMEPGYPSIGPLECAKISAQTLTELKSKPKDELFHRLEERLSARPSADTLEEMLTATEDLILPRPAIFTKPHLRVWLPSHFCGVTAVLALLQVEQRWPIELCFRRRTRENVSQIRGYKEGIDLWVLSPQQLQGITHLSGRSLSPLGVVAELPAGTFKLFVGRSRGNNEINVITFGNSAQWARLQAWLRKEPRTILAALRYKLVPAEEPLQSTCFNALEDGHAVVSPWSFLWDLSDFNSTSTDYSKSPVYLVGFQRQLSTLRHALYVGWIYLQRHQTRAANLALRHLPLSSLREKCDVLVSDAPLP